MARIRPINHQEATGKAKDLLDAVKAKLGMAPNMMKTMAQSPAVLDAYLAPRPTRRASTRSAITTWRPPA